MATYKLIEKATLTTTANYIEFTSIPDTYTDLILLSSLRSNRSAVNDQGDVKLNGTSITGKTLQGDGSNPGSEADAYLRPPAANATSNVFSNDSIYISNYSLSSQYKSVSIDGTMENSASGSYLYQCAGIYSSNAAVTTVQISCVNASWVSGSSVYLYGIKKS